MYGWLNDVAMRLIYEFRVFGADFEGERRRFDFSPFYALDIHIQKS